MYRIHIPDENRMIYLLCDEDKARKRTQEWRERGYNAYLEQSVESVSDDGNTYIVCWAALPFFGGK